MVREQTVGVVVWIVPKLLSPPVTVQILYNDTAELHNLLESIKSIPYVTSLQWSEMVEMIGDNNPLVITAFFNRSKQRGAQSG